MKRTLIALALAFAALASTGLAQEYSVVVDGVRSPVTAVTLNGVVYVPLQALTDVGVVATFDGGALSLTLPPKAAGGAGQRESVEGCLRQDLFNGVWRVRVTDVSPLTGDKPGWGVTVEVRNGSTTTLMPTDAGVDGTGEGIQLVLADGTILAADPYDVQELTFASLPQGGGLTHQLLFYLPSGASLGQPDKFLFEFHADGIGFSEQQAGVAFTVPNPSLRVRLGCG